MGDAVDFLLEQMVDYNIYSFDSGLDDWGDYFDDGYDLPERFKRRRSRPADPPERIGSVLFDVLRNIVKPRTFSERLERLKIITKSFPCACGGRLVFRTSRYGGFYGCYRHPDCNYKVNIHNNTGEPIGIASDSPTRLLRKRAHDLFDPYWKSKRINRSEAYRRLAIGLEMPLKKAHFGLMNEQQLRKAIKWIKKNGKIVLSNKHYTKRKCRKAKYSSN